MQSKACAAPKSWYLAISSNDAVPVAFRKSRSVRRRSQSQYPDPDFAALLSSGPNTLL
jgi:hypothetical protein